MPSKKKISERQAGTNNGKKCPGVVLQELKSTVKYTFERSKEDIKNLEKLRNHLKSRYHYKSYNTDSEIYRDLPNLYFNAVKENHDHELAIDELTAKLDQLEDLRTSFCRIFEICEVKNL